MEIYSDAEFIAWTGVMLWSVAIGVTAAFVTIGLFYLGAKWQRRRRRDFDRLDTFTGW